MYKYIFWLAFRNNYFEIVNLLKLNFLTNSFGIATRHDLMLISIDYIHKSKIKFKITTTIYQEAQWILNIITILKFKFLDSIKTN